VTVERDLHIWRLFDDFPLIWHLMSLVATYHPARCYCSVLLRALTATFLAQWGSAAQRTQHNDRLLTTTTQVLELMALGQLLPPPLSSLRDVIPHLKPQEVCSREHNICLSYAHGEGIRERLLITLCMPTEHRRIVVRTLSPFCFLFYIFIILHSPNVIRLFFFILHFLLQLNIFYFCYVFILLFFS
jgi:hypothetical protein